jgi:8-oxo-dGTP pyrophosphatase MutT (NUDIX family)
VILLRHGESSGFEVLLTRRAEDMAFLGGLYCFPGGTVRKEDCSETARGRCYGLLPSAARKIAGAHFTPNGALGLWIAAIRELFEETGILLAVKENGEPWVIGKNIRLFKRHARLLEKSWSFQSLLENDGLLCDASSLAYFSRWQTPADFSLRFDTRFFLAPLPAGQSPLPASSEVAHSLWISPDHALELFAKERLPMIFPTFASLRTLADFETLESLFREYRFDARKPSN